MKQYIAHIATAVMLLTLLALGISQKAAAFDPFPQSSNSPVCTQTDAAGNTSPVCAADGTKNPITGTDGVINKVANIFAVLTGIAAVVIIIIGGFEYVRSSGDSAKVNKAKDMILYALVGLIVVAVARAAVALVVSKL